MCQQNDKRRIKANTCSLITTPKHFSAQQSPGAAHSPHSWERHHPFAAGRDSSAISRFPPQHQEWWEAAPQQGLSYPQHQPHQLRDGAGTGEQQPNEHEELQQWHTPWLPESQHLLANMTGSKAHTGLALFWVFPSLALLTIALKVEVKRCCLSGFPDPLPAASGSWEGFVQKMNRHLDDVLHPFPSWSSLSGNGAFMLLSHNAKLKCPKCKPIPAHSVVLQGTDNTKCKSWKYQTTPEISTTVGTVSKKRISPDALLKSIVFRHHSDKKAINTRVEF